MNRTKLNKLFREKMWSRVIQSLLKLIYICEIFTLKNKKNVLVSRQNVIQCHSIPLKNICICKKYLIVFEAIKRFLSIYPGRRYGAMVSIVSQYEWSQIWFAWPQGNFYMETYNNKKKTWKCQLEIGFDGWINLVGDS